MAGELSPADRRAAIEQLEQIEATLTAMSMWIDADSPDRERASIALEDASKAAMAAAYLIERADRGRVAELVHRRMSGARYQD